MCVWGGGGGGGGGGGVGGVDRWLSGGRINHNTCGYKQRLGRVLNSDKF